MARLQDEIKQREFVSHKQEAMVNILYTHSWLLDAMNDLFKKYDLTNQQFNVLRILKGKHPQPLSAGDVKAVMIDKCPDLTRLIHRLKIKGLVLSQKNPSNRRKVQLSITEKGIELLDEMNPHITASNYFLNGINEEEAKTLSNLLDKVRE